MMTLENLDIDEIVRLAAGGDRSATELLLVRYRDRLRKMIAVRMDPRLVARLDPSDVVQDVLAEASKRLPDYLRQPPIAFYPWLRQIAWDRLCELHRCHVRAQKRSVTRERQWDMALSGQSVNELAILLVASGTSPSGQLMRKELHRRVRGALAQLAPHDREALVMRHLEQLSMKEIAAVLDTTEKAAKSRHRRALERLLRLLGHDVAEQ